MEEEEKKKKSYWKKLKKFFHKNERRQGIACIIGAIAGAYLSVILGFATVKAVGLPKALLSLTTFLIAVVSIMLLIFGIYKVVDWDFC